LKCSTYFVLRFPLQDKQRCAHIFISHNRSKYSVIIEEIWANSVL
jgi:hypothetical protein